MGFKVGDMTGGRRGRKAKPLGCLRKASGFNDLGENLDCA
jgi:hypothetical protein